MAKTHTDTPTPPTLHPDTLLSRAATAAALTDRGYRVSPQTLARLACERGGPPYTLWGSRASYRWGSTLRWAEERAGAPAATARRRKAPPLDVTARAPAAAPFAA